MSYIVNFRSVALGITILSLVYCSNDKKSTANSNDTSRVGQASEEPLSRADRTIEIPSTVDKANSENKNPADKSKSDRSVPTLDPKVEMQREFNQKLESVRYPDGNTIEGFEYKKWDIPNRQDFVKWIKASGNIIKEALDTLPETYKLEISGHADTSGPEEKTGNKLGNIYYSKKRAESVKNSLVKLGFPENRMLVNGLGSSEPIPGVEGTSAKNRRVTFKITGDEKE